VCDADVSGSFVTKPQPVEVAVGDDAKLVCQSDLDAAVNWQVQQFSSSSGGKRVCYNGNIVDGYTEKYSVDTERTVEQYKAYNLVIHKADYDDAGEYTCVENAGIGDSASANLTVVGRSSAGKDSFIVVSYLTLVWFGTRVVRLAKNDLLVFSSVLQKNCGFRFAFSFKN